VASLVQLDDFVGSAVAGSALGTGLTELDQVAGRNAPWCAMEEVAINDGTAFCRR
jgi:hypothetical protein